MAKAKRPSYKDLQEERDRLDRENCWLRQILTTDETDSGRYVVTKGYRPGTKVSYYWKLFRATGAAGGLVHCTFKGADSRFGTTHFLGTLDDLQRHVEARLSQLDDEDKAIEVLERFKARRQDLLDKLTGNRQEATRG